MRRLPIALTAFALTITTSDAKSNSLPEAALGGWCMWYIAPMIAQAIAGARMGPPPPPPPGLRPVSPPPHLRKAPAPLQADSAFPEIPDSQ
jgi:hypothetical protein